MLFHEYSHCNLSDDTQSTSRVPHINYITLDKITPNLTTDVDGWRNETSISKTLL